MITGFAHTALRVPDVDAAAAWCRDVLGLHVLSPPYLMTGDEIERDMGGLVPSPVEVKAAIVGTDDDDRVLELIEYPRVDAGEGRAPDVTAVGFTHVGLLCDDVEAARADLEARGVRFLTDGVADVAGLRTTWFCDPWGNVFILLEKRQPDRPYWRQW